jgi:A/G-specific adenine glycosylase
MPPGGDLKKRFRIILLKWNKEKNSRQMPWKGEKDPYKIWLSEVILQQTRVEQGLAYYQRFISNFPTIIKLANAKDQTVIKLWEGLGYYSRCRNLLETARYISKKLNGKFPNRYEDIRALKGVGNYTAAAISSFAFNLPHAVVDGNVYRVLSRVFGIDKPVDITGGKQFFLSLAGELLDKKEPGSYNQAIMDFGAVICKPVPLCAECVFRKECFAFQNQRIEELPVKKKKIVIKKRWFYYLVLNFKNKIAITQRVKRDIWNQLYEFPMIEQQRVRKVKDILKEAEKENLLIPGTYKLTSQSAVFEQKLSHQLIHAQFFVLQVTANTVQKKIKWVTRKQLGQYPFPQIINQYLYK